MSWRIEGNDYVPQQSLNTVKKLPLGTYYVRFSDMIGYYLEKIEDFTLPEKVYGDTSVINRWLKSYESNARNTGVILTGVKGSGKTLLSKKCAIDSGLPIVIIDRAYQGSSFISFITNPELGDICVFIDEFEKVYSERGSEDSLLTILDGTFNTHNLFIFTCNKMHTNEYLTNRPSRIRYRSHFESLPEDIIDEVIEDLLQTKEHAQSIKEALQRVGIVTFDLLITLIKEVDLFKESAMDVVKYLNVVPETVLVDVFEVWKGKPYQIGSSERFGEYANFHIRRSFRAIDDPEYVDENYQNDEDPIKGLPNHVINKTSDFIRKDSDTWECKNDKGHFILKRTVYSQFLF